MVGGCDTGCMLRKSLYLISKIWCFLELLIKNKQYPLILISKSKKLKNLKYKPKFIDFTNFI